MIPAPVPVVLCDNNPSFEAKAVAFSSALSLEAQLRVDEVISIPMP